MNGRLEKRALQPVLAWLRLMRVYQKMSRAAASQLRNAQLSLAQFDLLNQVGLAEGATQQELADRLLVTKGNICQLLDRLQSQQLLVRRQEGRVNRIYLTDEGRRLVAQTLPEHEAVITELFEALSPDEQRQLLSLLRQLDHDLK